MILDTAETNTTAPASNISKETVIDINDLSFSWSEGHAPVLEIEQFRVTRGERLFIMGPSGSGKSTLLGLLTGITVPQAGDVWVLGQSLSQLTATSRDRFRADYIGYIFQMFNLIPYLSVVENVILPCQFSELRRKKGCQDNSSPEKEALRLLEHLNLKKLELLNCDVSELSVGQQQRVAAARALIGKPDLVVADEPTSALDTAHQKDFLDLLFEECHRADSTLIFVSHDERLAPLFDRVVELRQINCSGGKVEGGLQ